MTRSITILFLFISQTLLSQTSADLDINNVRATINLRHSLFQDLNTTGPGFEVPINSGKHTIYGAGLWIGGKDINGQLFLANQRYGETDFRAGTSSKFQRVWKIDLSTIQYHQQHYSDAGYVMPYVIEFWPAHGDTMVGEEFYMAPFFDVNFNGTYEPELGDYPYIKGDQAIWWFMSDDTIHDSGAQPLNINVHAMAYAYKCGDSAVDHTIFVDYKIINKSTSTYFDVWYGHNVDYDIGNYSNDYIGTSVRNGVFYGYNGQSSDMGAGGYGTNPPAQGCMIYGPDQDLDGEDNPGPSFFNNYYLPLDTALLYDGVTYLGQGTHYGDGIIDNERLGLRRTIGVGNSSTSPITEPATAAECYNYLQAIWPDGTPLAHEGVGYPGSNPVNASFIYPDTTDVQFWSTAGDSVPTWSEITENNLIGDRRMMGSTGPKIITPYQEDSLTFVYVFGRDYTTNDPLASVEVMLERANTIRTYMANCCSFCSNSVGLNDLESLSEISIFPNPSKNIFTITSTTLPDRIEVYNNMGQLVLSESNLSEPSTELDLSSFGPGVYYAVINVKNQRITKKLVKTE